LDAIPPSARGLDGGLDCFRAGIHRQRGVEPGQRADFRQEGSEPVVEIGARGHCKPLRLRVERGEDAGMGVAMARRRIGAHHVDVASAGGIPEIRALAARKHDRKRLVVARAVSVLELHRVHGTSPDTFADSTTRIYYAAATPAAEV